MTSGDYPSPATAHFVHKGLNLNKSIHCLDVASSCSSFLSAFRSALGFISTGANTLVIASEVKHKGLSHDDFRTQSLFGDGAAGVFLEKNISETKNKDFFYFCYQESITAIAENICIPVGGSRTITTIENINQNKLVLQNPKETYLQIVKSITEAIEHSLKIKNEILLENNISLPHDFPGSIYIHQANKNIINEVKNRVSKNIANKIPTLMADTGNAVCASLPLLRNRVLFLKSLFFYKKETFSKKNIIPYFISACKNSSLFSYKIHKSGIQFTASFENETIHIYDDNCTAIENSWLTKLCEEEFNDLQDQFKNELFTCQNSENKQIKCLDIWIAVGGGFQIISMIHGKI